MKEELNKEQELIQILKMVAPGTELREGLENILKARTGALIVISDSPDVMKLAVLKLMRSILQLKFMSLLKWMVL